jgi:hypothetical protein
MVAKMLFGLILFGAAFAGDAAAGSDQHAASQNPATPAPQCLNFAPAGKRAITKEDIPKGMGDLELVARLAYAETLAANCPDKNQELSEGIAAVILNRVRAFEEKGKDDAYRRVVFGKMQFASSLHFYSKAQWKAFTCPTDQAFYRTVYMTVVQMNNGELKNRKYASATHYYLHNHFEKFQDQPWGREAKLVANLGGNCVGVYSLDKGFLHAPY